MHSLTNTLANSLTCTLSHSPKHERVSPRSNGRRNLSRCSAVPNLAMVSMLPVSGAEQFKAEAQNKHLADRAEEGEKEKGRGGD